MKTSPKIVAIPRNIAQGGFEAGQRGRRLRAIPTSAVAINTAIRQYGRNAIARSRFLCVNNPLMVQAKEEFVAALVGDGIKPSFNVADPAVKKELQELWLEWTDESDADGLTDLYGQQNITASEMFEAGECFVRIRPRFLMDGLSVPMQLQILPSEMCPFEYNLALPNGGKIEMGVEFDSIGRRVAYWFFRNHPGELAINYNNALPYLYRISADQILHLFKPIRAGQIRGVPHTLAGIITMALLDLYDDAELERKRTAALFTAFITRQSGEEADESPLTGAPTSTHGHSTTGQTDATMEPGATVELTDGQNVSFGQPADVGGNYEAFQYRNLLRAAAGVGLPYMALTGDLKQANYGSQRGGMISFRRRISSLQNSVMIFQLCRPIAAAWLQAAILGGSITTFKPSQFVSDPRSFGKRIRWITPKWDWIDPLKDLTAEKLAVDSCFKPRSDVVEAMGYDAVETDELIAADQARAEGLGLKFATIRTGIVVSPTADTDDISSLNGPPDDQAAVPGAPPAPPAKKPLESPKPGGKNPPKSKLRAKPGPFGTRFIWDA